ncbi:MAG: hypothetical protein NW205_04395 [Hyphomicrobiaceae bacterium]|nr:hypothetical protein [Hyphomicrobiaceae bacterium]
MGEESHRAGGSTDATGVGAEVFEAFTRQVLMPLMGKAAASPEEVRSVLATVRTKLDALEVLLGDLPGQVAGEGEAPRARNGHAPNAAPNGSARGADGAVNGATAPTSTGRSSLQAASGEDPFDDFGRNQRARLRELTLLEFLARDTRAYPLQQVMSALAERGFDDTSGAIVSHMHRLKRVGVINQPAAGLYEITTDGLGHLRKIKSAFGPLLGMDQRT